MENYFRFFFYFSFFLVIVSSSFAVSSHLTINSPNFFQEQNNIYMPIHYLKGEFLSFKFCPTKLPKNLSFFLISNNKKINLSINVYKENTNIKIPCYFSNYNLDNISSPSFNLNINYSIGNIKTNLKRTFILQKRSKLIDHVLSENYSSLDSLDLSYYLIVLNSIQTLDNPKSQKIYNILKNSRNNLLKCWPSSFCSLSSTITILRNLKLAGYPLTSRLLNDGKVYLEQNVISNKNKPYSLILTFPNLNISSQCKLKIDSNTLNQTFTSIHYTYIFNANSSFSLDCNSTLPQIKLIVKNSQSNSILETTYNNTKSFSYLLSQFECIGDNNQCSFTNTANTLMTYGASFKNSNLLQNFLNVYISSSNSKTTIQTPTPNEDGGRYLFVKSNANLINTLEFNQNNDGSWTNNLLFNRILPTAWVVLGLEKNGINEYVNDAKNWIYYNEPEFGWGSIIKNTIAFLSIKEKIKPYININMKNIISNNTEFIVSNPTIFNLKNIKLLFSSSINPYIFYTESLGNLPAFSKFKFNVSANSSFIGTLSGHMIITGIDDKNKLINLINSPINIKGKSGFSISKKDIFTNKNSTNILIPFNYDLNSASNCSFLNPITNKKQNFLISKTSKILNLASSNKVSSLNYTLNFDCKFGGIFYQNKILFHLNISSKSFQILNSNLTINQNLDSVIKIKSFLNRVQTLTFNISGPSHLIVTAFENPKLLAKQSTLNIYFNTSDFTYLEKLNNPGKLKITSNTGFVQIIPIVINKVKIPVHKSIYFWIILIFLIFIILFILLFIYRYIQKKREDEKNKKNKNHDGDFIIDI